MVARSETDRLVKLKEAASILGRTKWQVVGLIQQLRIRGVKQKGRWYVLQSELDDFLDRTRRHAPGKEMFDDRTPN